MASSFTTNKSLEKPANGDYVDTWNVPVNGDMDIIDQAFGGTTALNATGGSATLTSTQYRSLSLSVTGAITGNVTYTIPAGVGGAWVVRNATTGSFDVIFTVSGSATPVTLLRNKLNYIYSDGTNMRSITNQVIDVAQGGTGSSSLTANNVLLGNGTGALQTVAPGSSGNVLTSNGTTWVSQTVASVTAVNTISFGSTGFTPSTATSGAVTVAGTLNIANGGTGATSASQARTSLSAATSGANSDITSLSGLTTPLSIAQGGTASNTAADARTALDVPSRAGSGASGTWGINITGNAATVTNGITTANIGSYAPSLTGTGASGTWGINITGNAATATNGLTTSNFNSYAPTLTGTGASGTWGINITGNSNYANSSGTANFATSAGLILSDGAFLNGLTFHDFTTMPSFAGRFTIGIVSASAATAGRLLIQLGTAGGVTTSGYISGTTYAGSTFSSSNGFVLNPNANENDIFTGVVTCTKVAGNLWFSSGNLAFDNVVGANTSGGYVNLGGAIDRVRLTTDTGATFDSGAVYIIWG